MYILVEYTDQYQKVKLFREGVNTKFVKRSPKEKFDACNRFTNEIDCNDINSYGLNKMKCQFIKGICISTRQEVERKQLLSDLQNIVFTRRVKKSGKQQEVTDYTKMKLWQEALNKANDYIAQILVVKKLNTSEINQLAFEQRVKLTEYSEFLRTWTPENRTELLDSVIEEPTYDNLTERDELVDVLPPTKEQKEKAPTVPVQPKLEEVQEGVPEDITRYTTISLPKTVTKNKIVGNKQLIIGNKYLLPDDSISILLEKPTIKEPNKKLVFENGQSFDKSGVTIREYKKTDLIEQVNVKISKDTLKLLQNPPSDFKYTVIEKEYKIDKSTISIKYLKKVNKTVPLDILYKVYIETIMEEPTLPQDEITMNIVYQTMGKVLHSTYGKDENGLLELEELYPATRDAKVHALKYSVDLNEVSKTVSDEIKLIDVINYYNKVLPTIKTISHEIISNLQYGILNKEYKLLKRYVKLAEKHLTNDIDESILKLLDESKKVLFEEEQRKTKKVKEPLEPMPSEPGPSEPGPQGPQGPPVPSVNVSYMVQKRRKKKEDD
jgi:hypothetical protein